MRSAPPLMTLSFTQQNKRQSYKLLRFPRKLSRNGGVQWKLSVTQSLDGIEIGGADGWVDSENDAHANGDAKGQRHWPTCKVERQVIRFGCEQI